jgi:DNA-binding GntR family transcriptional regulator
LIEALKNLDAETATRIMDHHLHAVEDRAKVDEKDDGPDITEILSRYISVSD